MDKLFTEKERADADALIPALERRLLQAKLKPEQEKVLREYLAGSGNWTRAPFSTPSGW